MNALNAVVTVKEAAQLFNVSKRTIYYHINKGNLAWRKADTLILVDLASLNRLYKRIYNLPPKTIRSYVQNTLQAS